MQKKLVSIIVPVYNVDKYLDKCVESLVNQTYKNLEIILVDDGSPDNCPELCDCWAKKDSRIKVIHKNNGGLSDARNVGFDISTGEYISFIDSDDWIKSEFIETLVNLLDEGADIADCATRLCDEGNNTLSVRGFKADRKLDNIEALRTLLNESGIYQTVWNKLYKRECIKDIKFEVGRLHEDDFWTWRIFRNAKTVHISSKPMYNYVQRRTSIMGSGYSLRTLDALDAVYICYLSLFDNDDYRNAVVRRLVSSCLYHMQSAYKCLNKQERKIAFNKVNDYLNMSNVRNYAKSLKSPWYRLFLKFPRFIAIIRNFLNIGY